MEKIKSLFGWLFTTPVGILFVLGVVAACIGTTVAVPFVGAVGGMAMVVVALGLSNSARVARATKGWLGIPSALALGIVLNTLVPGGWVVFVLGSVGTALVLFAVGGIVDRLLKKVLDVNVNARA